jgi:hypothetical protein
VRRTRLPLREPKVLGKPARRDPNHHQ